MAKQWIVQDDIKTLETRFDISGDPFQRVTCSRGPEYVMEMSESDCRLYDWASIVAVVLMPIISFVTTIFVLVSI